MRIITLLAVALMFTTPLSAQQIQSRDTMIASALDEYGKVAGSWFLNEKCTFLSKEERSSFEESVALITVTLGREIGNPTILFVIQKGAKSATEKPEYSGCNSTSKELFQYGYDHSKNWSDQIRRLQAEVGKKG
ncbi:hypothetical protein [Microbulbifer pacificus]|uniref:hypothetical protein n=1 Tax=Microbulbifer pacificus TaxID=407164 RepID=UPI000CF37AAB|nr:hypothetical protein [Microbulbifer pacificus]